MTPLEAAMLGLYLMGFQLITIDRDGSMTAFLSDPHIDEEYGSWDSDNEYLCIWPNRSPGETEIIAGLKAYPYNTPVELLPWLQSRNIVIPEVRNE